MDRAAEVVVVAWSVWSLSWGRLRSFARAHSLPVSGSGEGDPPPDTAMAIPPPTAASTRPAMAVRRTVPLRRVIGEGLSLASRKRYFAPRSKRGSASPIRSSFACGSRGADDVSNVRPTALLELR